MARVYLSKEAFGDLERLDEFLRQTGDPLAYALLDFIMDALHVLTHQPGIGRPIDDRLRELIIRRGRSGYLARYEYDEAVDIVRVMRLRHQRESGYTAEEI